MRQKQSLKASVQTIGLSVEDWLINCVSAFMSGEIMLALAWCVRSSGVCSETLYVVPLVYGAIFLCNHWYPRAVKGIRPQPTGICVCCDRQFTLMSLDGRWPPGSSLWDWNHHNTVDLVSGYGGMDDLFVFWFFFLFYICCSCLILLFQTESYV